MVDKRRIYDIASEGGFPDQPARALGDALEDELGALATKDDLGQFAERTDHRFNLVDEHFDAVDQRFAAQDRRITDLFAGQDRRITDLFAAQDESDLFAGPDLTASVRRPGRADRRRMSALLHSTSISGSTRALLAVEGRLDEILTQLGGGSASDP